MALLKDTVIQGGLVVTGSIIGNASSATVSSSCSGNAVSASRFLGFTSNSSSWTWGTLTTANGYTQINCQNDASGGSIGYAYKDSQTSMQLNGFYYQNEGQNQVVDILSTQTLTNKTITALATLGVLSLQSYTGVQSSSGIHFNGDNNSYCAYVNAGDQLYIGSASSSGKGIVFSYGNVVSIGDYTLANGCGTTMSLSGTELTITIP